MHFFQNGSFYGVNRITGLQHNMLQLLLVSDLNVTIACERLPPISHGEAKLLDELLVVANVAEGLKMANSSLHTNYAIAQIRYVADDTGPEQVYRYLCQQIVEHLACGGKFVNASAEHAVK
jgi:hypothetical protein